MSKLTAYRSQSKKQTATLDNIYLQQNSTALALGHIREDTMLLKGQLENTAEQFPFLLTRSSIIESTKTEVFDDKSCADAIAGSLMFSNINQREETVPRAYEKTFEWIFGDPQSSELTDPIVAHLSPFVPWLESPSSDIYWITGKPGAGKSTMMKYLLQHPLTREKAAAWSNSSGRQLLWGSFFFWNAGSLIQKSQEGLLRALLYQMITQSPDITPGICPRRWALCKSLGPGSVKRAPDWQWKELMEAFSLLSLLIGDRFNLVLFIDGLDEYEGDHQKLIEFAESLNMKEGTKICVSSRPWNVFSDAFRNKRNLRMDQVTAADISRYVRGIFETTPAFQDWRESSPIEAEMLMHNIVTRAQGVFLWVSVVVAQIRLGLREGDSISELNAVLEDIPADLTSLYDNIWRRIQPSYIKSSSQIFQIHQCTIDSDGKTDAVLLYLADEHASAAVNDLDAVMETRQEHVKSIVKRRLDSRTRGLLEIADDGYVNYLHRTVKEWIEPRWSEIRSKGSSNFDPHLAILRALIIYYRSASEQWSFFSNREAFTKKLWLIVFRCFSHALRVRDAPHTSSTLVELLDRFDLDMSRAWDKHRKANTAEEKIEPNLSLRRAPRLDSTGIDYSATCALNKASIPNVHWSQTLFSDYRSTEIEMGFVGLAAQFGILSYVRSKYRVDASLLTSSGPALLSCAVLGFENFRSYDGVSHEDYGDENTYNGRIELVKFILGEVDSRSAFQSGGMLERIPTLTKILELQPKAGNASISTSMYKDTILKLLNQWSWQTERQEWRKTALRRLGNVFKKKS